MFDRLDLTKLVMMRVLGKSNIWLIRQLNITTVRNKRLMQIQLWFI